MSQLYTLEEVVLDLLRQCGIDTSIRSEPPIPVWSVITQCRVNVSQIEEPGWCVASRDRTIWLDSKKSEAYKRFDAAYHLGHVLLNEPRERRSWSTLHPPLKLEAWLGEHSRALDFAGELLMPRRFVIPWLNMRLNDEEMAQVFGVPVPHMSIRIERMRLAQEMSGIS